MGAVAVSTRDISFRKSPEITAFTCGAALPGAERLHAGGTKVRTSNTVQLIRARFRWKTRTRDFARSLLRLLLLPRRRWIGWQVRQRQLPIRVALSRPAARQRLHPIGLRGRKVSRFTAITA